MVILQIALGVLAVPACYAIVMLPVWMADYDYDRHMKKVRAGQ